MWPRGSSLLLPQVDLPNKVFYGRQAWMYLRPSALGGTLCLQLQPGNELQERKIDLFSLLLALGTSVVVLPRGSGGRSPCPNIQGMGRGKGEAGREVSR